ncbi:MAG: 3-dehydroquinate dehydratase [Clostridia bacterium]|nr:3-dehydroquinate dehydratase [Clostridia bacterium]
MKLLIINGPNLNMLSKRSQEHYGELTLKQLNNQVRRYAKDRGISCQFYQSSYEGDIINKLEHAKVNGIILNAGALSHYSYAIRDCIECIDIPVVEVHLSDINAREDFRKVRVFDGVVAQLYSGGKQESYFRAVDYYKELFK